MQDLAGCAVFLGWGAGRSWTPPARQVSGVGLVLGPVSMVLTDLPAGLWGHGGTVPV